MKKQSNFRKLMVYAGNHRFLTYASWILSAISALLALVPYWYIWKIMQEALAVMPDFTQATHLVSNAWMAVVFAVASGLIYVAGLMCSHLAAFRVARTMRIALTHHLVRLPLGFADQFGSGKLRKIINDSSAATENYLAHKLPDTAGALATPIGLLVLLFVFDWRLGLLSLVPVVLGFVIMLSMTGEKMKKRMAEYQNSLEVMSNEAVEYVRGIPVVKTFGQTVFSFRRFKDSIDSYKKWVIAYTKELCMPMVAYTAAINSVFAFLIGAAVVITSGGISRAFILNLMFYIIVAPIIALTLTKIMYQSENAMIVNDALTRIEWVLSIKPLEIVSPQALPQGCDIAVNAVSFSYDGTRNALEDISLTIKEGEKVAFVGPSGSGKSTLANIIARFFDPQQGTVEIGGVDVKSIPKDQLMDTVSFVFQNSRLLKASILDNIRMGKPQASRAEIMEAIRIAQCQDIIDKFSQGVDTIIGSQGVYLSGGEQQRLIIARAILKNAPILILDEATAFADPDNEVRVQKALSALSVNKTVIMIAHRLSTVRTADCIYVLENGQIAESGKPDDLLQAQGLFARMWASYQTSVQWKVKKEEMPL